MHNGRLFIVSGPSGAGKDTLIARILPEFPDLFLSVSMTTRKPRGKEKNGVDYFFVSEKYFREQIANNSMLEYADYCTVCYGTPKKPVEDALKNGKSVILVIERKGMENIKHIVPDAVTIFIAPPSIEILKQRILARKTETPEAMAKRLEKAMEEMEKRYDYDYIVVNDELETAADELKSILKKYL